MPELFLWDEIFFCSPCRFGFVYNNTGAKCPLVFWNGWVLRTSMNRIAIWIFFLSLSPSVDIPRSGIIPYNPHCYLTPLSPYFLPRRVPGIVTPSLRMKTGGGNSAWEETWAKNHICSSHTKLDCYQFILKDIQKRRSSKKYIYIRPYEWERTEDHRIDRIAMLLFIHTQMAWK